MKAGSKRWSLVVLVLGCAGTEDAAGAACRGDHFAGDAATLKQLADCTRVSGNLVFTGNELDVVTLTSLRSVDGNFSIWGNPNLTEVNLSELARVGG